MSKVNAISRKKMGDNYERKRATKGEYSSNVRRTIIIIKEEAK